MTDKELISNHLDSLSEDKRQAIVSMLENMSDSERRGFVSESVARLKSAQSPYPQFEGFPTFTPLTPNTDLPIPPIQAERQQVFENAFVKGLAGVNRPELGFEGRYPVQDILGQIAGTGVSLIGATKIVGLAGKIPAVGRLFQLGRGTEGIAQLTGRVTSSGIRGSAVGTVLGAGQQTGSVLTGGDFEAGDVAKDAVLFGVLDAVTAGVGGSIKIAKEGLKASQLQKALEVGDLKLAEGLVKELKPSLPKIQQEQLDELLPSLRKIQEGKPIGLKDTPLGKDPVANEVQRKTVFNPQKELSPGQARVAGVAAPIIRKSEEEALKSAPVLANRPLTRGKMSLSLQNPIRFFENLGAKVKDMFYYPVVAAEKQARVETDVLISELKSLSKAKGITKQSSERISIYGIAQQEGGLDIIKANGKELPVLNADELRVYNWARTKYDDIFKGINDARRASYQQPIPKVQNYMTFFRNLDDLERAGRGGMFAEVESLTDKFITSKDTAFRFGRSRVDNEKAGMVFDIFNQFPTYVQTAMRHIKLSPVLAKQTELIDGVYKSGFKLSEKNPQAYSEIKQWINHNAGRVEEFGSPKLNQILRKLNGNITMAVLSANLRTAIVQPTALVLSNTMIGTKWLAKGIRGIFSRRLRKFALENSDVLLTRSHDAALEDALTVVYGGGKSLRTTLGRAGLWPLQALDNEAALATWIGAYKQAQSVLKMSSRQAMKYADDIVIKTQGSAARSQLSPLQRTTLGKSLTTFNTFTINQWGLLRREVLGIGNKTLSKREATQRLMRLIVGTTLVNSLFEDVIGINSPYPSPFSAYAKSLKRGNSEERAVGDALLEFTEVMPIVGGAARYGSLPAPVQLFSDVAQIVSGRQKTPKKIIEAGGKILGVPGTAQTTKILYPPKEQ